MFTTLHRVQSILNKEQFSLPTVSQVVEINQLEINYETF